MKNIISHEVKITVSNIDIAAQLTIPENAESLVIFSHGSGSSRHSPRNKYVAIELNKKNIATLLVDLLTPKEDEDFENRFNIDLLSERLIGVTECFLHHPDYRNLRIGYFGASTGAASALRAAGRFGNKIHAVVSRGGRTDLAGTILPLIKSPVLFIVGSLDTLVIELNIMSFNELKCEKEMKIIHGASHLFEDPGKLEEMTTFATSFFKII